MLNKIWFGLLLTSVVSAVLTGHVHDLIIAVSDQAQFAFSLVLGLTGIFAFWLGIMGIAEDAGLIALLARGLRPVMIRLFPSVPKDHPAMGDMVMNIAANMLGLANAATPFGLRAMQALNQLNKKPGVATDAMCTFLAINTSSVQLFPMTAMSYLALAGAAEPENIIWTSLLATIVSTAVAIIMDYCFRRRDKRDHGLQKRQVA